MNPSNSCTNENGVIGSSDYCIYNYEKFILAASSLAGVPVVSLEIGNLNFYKVWARAIDGGSVSSLFLICRPAGYFFLPIWHIPLKNVPVVIIT